MEKKIPAEKPENEAATRRFSPEKINKKPETGKENLYGSDSAEHERAFKFKVPEKPSSLPLIVIAAVIVLIFLALAVYHMIRSHQNSLVLKKAAEFKIQGPTNHGLLESSGYKKPKSKTVELKVHAFSDDVFYGEAPVKVKPEGSVVSDKTDPILVALGDALNIRIRMIFGITIKKIGDMVLETSSGDFAGFKISSLITQPVSQVIREEISVITPSGGILKIKNRILESFTRSNYEQLLQDLKKSGIEAISTIKPEENSVQVQLKPGDIRYKPATGDDFLITGQGAGSIKLDMAITDMASKLSKTYRIIKRKIMIEEKFFNIYKIDDKGRIPLLYIYEKGGRVWGIQIVHEKFLTEKGIGIGATIATIRIYYTNIKIAAIPGILTFVFVDQLDKKDIKFILADDNRINFEREVFPFDIKIQSILIGKSPYLN